ncbi:MAG: glycosyl hydrolase, partial [Oscillospiraceae bacterium]|nr:glycosyl hydrolase [Oscillospiraceae bacterium]
MEIEKILAGMTVEEKAALVSGTDFMYTNPIPRLGVPSLCMSDGPHGLRKQIGSGDDNGVSRSEPATAFPSASCTASGWNPENLRRMGAAIAEECRHYGM